MLEMRSCAPIAGAVSSETPVCPMTNENAGVSLVLVAAFLVDLEAGEAEGMSNKPNWPDTVAAALLAAAMLLLLIVILA